jgi:hypothetical protein
MMQGLVMSPTESLYGRAKEAFQLRPLAPGYLPKALGFASVREAITAYAVWGGVPR